MNATSFEIKTAGENALIIYFGEAANPAVAAQVQQATRALESLLADRLIDLTPSYASLLVIFDQDKSDPWQIRQTIQSALKTLSTENKQHQGKLVELPVYYHPETGPDLEALASHAGLTTDEVIDLHQSQEYLVYAIGFAPGFAYLGEVDPRIAKPRLTTPRLKVPKGAVAIADRQTAVYPASSPGGWNLIGNCPISLFDAHSEPYMPVTVGDRVRFRAIDRAEYLQLGGKLESMA